MFKFRAANPSVNSTPVSKRWKHFLLLWLVMNATIWSATVLYLLLRPTSYTSKWLLNLPAAGSSTNVNVPDIGQASSWNDSPYKNFADPRENYKLLAESDDILETAANQLKIPVNRFGKPQIKIIDNTTLMRFEIKGDHPIQSQQKALALMNAFQATLHKLRLQEIDQQDSNLQIALKSDKQKLQIAKQALYDYKANSGLTSTEQLRDLSINVEGLRRQRAETTAQLKQINARFKQLSASLSLSGQQAADALALQSDRVFQEYLANYSQASATLASLSAKYLPSHPTLINKQQEKNAASAALLQQGKLLMGRTVSIASLEKLIVRGGGSSNSSSQRANLFQELISLQEQQQGIEAQVQELNQQITQLELRLNFLSQQESKLDSLNREVKVAEAILTSNVTKLNLKKSDISTSYPEISTVTNPSLPKEPSNPKPLFVLLGSVVCSILLTTGTRTLWEYERKKLERIQDTNNKIPPIKSISELTSISNVGHNSSRPDEVHPPS
ncbi:MAG: hypothetical protein KME21_01630 [Desmonostoc vinosum HA7617-LM4]|jgi:uncharacterized protein involved in exopolysaccharide biosynthesis|nr:hypothetical protein [Desmonostoc vinosum HA7617-LM4]